VDGHLLLDGTEWTRTMADTQKDFQTDRQHSGAQVGEMSINLCALVCALSGSVLRSKNR
jgi:hypothetical protein